MHKADEIYGNTPGTLTRRPRHGEGGLSSRYLADHADKAGTDDCLVPVPIDSTFRIAERLSILLILPLFGFLSRLIPKSHSSHPRLKFPFVPYNRFEVPV